MSFEDMSIAELSAYLANQGALTAEEEMRLAKDERRGVAELLKRYQKKKASKLAEETRLQKLLVEERHLTRQGFRIIAGVDEAGRGPLAGPVVAAAVVLNQEALIHKLNDSKKLSPEMREELVDQVIFNSHCYGVGIASNHEIDQYNIHNASMLAMNRALEKLSPVPDFVLVDGYPIKQSLFKQKAIKQGDSLSLSIAAASVLAKVTRDRLMLEMDKKYPQYGFKKNMGYGTEEHRQALNHHGPCPLHRRSFRLNYG
ncbi:MAG: ribonuclease HII [Bacillota bacterium]